MASSTTASQAELNANQVPLQWRDNCSALVEFSFDRVGVEAHSGVVFLRSRGEESGEVDDEE